MSRLPVVFFLKLISPFSASYRGFDEPWSAIGKTKEKPTQTMDEQNPQGAAEEGEQPQMLDETEVTYMMELYKKKIEKNKDPAVMKAVHNKTHCG